MLNAWTKTAALVAGAMILGACSDGAESPVAAEAPGAVFAAGTANDPAMRMRAELRGRSDQATAAAVERGNRVVTVGFKPEDAPWGVDARGRSLVPEAARARHLRTVEGMATRVLHRFQGIPAITVELPNAQVALQLRRLPWVDYVAEATQLLTPDAALVECYDAWGYPSAPRGTVTGPEQIPWNITRVRADAAWSLATGANPQNKELSILDDGADEQQANLPLGTDLGNAVVYAWYASPTGYDGTHGTPVLGAASARWNGVGVVGVAPGSTTRVLKIYDPASAQSWDYWTAFAIDGNAQFSRVMSISYSSKLTSSTPPPSFVAMYDAIKRGYYQQGTIFVASTGNQWSATTYAYPAAYPEVVGVGGSGYSDEYVLNNYAPGNVEISAPAYDVGTICKGGSAGTADGTSFGTPMVAGAFMLLKERFPFESADQLRDRLRRTARPMGNTQQSGAGRMDVYAALTS